jgi:hypothetical protein
VTAALQYAALACVLAGLVSGGLAAVIARDVRIGLRVALDLWLAAGLLRLAMPQSDDQLLAAAAIIAVRQLVVAALRRSPSRMAQSVVSRGDAGA